MKRPKTLDTQTWSRLIEWLPAPFREGRKPYAFMFACFMIVVALLYAQISPYAHAQGLFLSLAGFLFLLVLATYWGMSLAWAVHLGTVGGLILLVYAVWNTGGIYSPRLAWVLVLPLTPFYMLGRGAGLFWSLIALVVQLFMALAMAQGWTPHFEPGHDHVTSSTVTIFLVTGVLMIVPTIYDQLTRRTLRRIVLHQRTQERQQKALEQELHNRELFMANISHELRTPMNAILGFNAFLLSRVQDKPEAIKVLTHTRQSADHLMTVINDILDYSQLQAGKLQIQVEAFDLHELLRHAFELFLPRVRSSRLDYRMQLDPALPRWVSSDRHRIMQVLVNLLGNALKFTHEGSVLLRVQWQHQQALLEVQDTGIGIAPERQNRIFSRFSQANGDIQHRYGGNGLGLAISRQLVELLGGDIGFESEPGRGSRFWFRLPLTVSDLAVSGDRHKHPQQPLQTANMPWRFLVVDDHPINRLLVKKVLQNAWPQANVSEAPDGQQCLDRLAQQTADLVLMDMVMPVMDGIEATRQLRQNPSWQTLPVLGLTANVNPADLHTFEQAGLNAVLLKPFEPALLCARVEQLLLQRRASGDAEFTS